MFGGFQMSTIRQSGRNSSRILISFDVDDHQSMKKAVDFCALSETSAIVEVRRQRLRGIRRMLLSEIKRTPEAKTFVRYFELSPQGRSVLVQTAYGGTVALETADWPLQAVSVLGIFMSSQNRESIVGDIEERFGQLVEKEGRPAATRWIWREVVHSFFFLAFDALKRVSGIEKLYRRIGS
jgi:hypothetical protein